MEERIRTLRGIWDIELRDKMAEKDVACEVLLKEKMEAHELSFEAERRRGLKLEASKWRQALKGTHSLTHSLAYSLTHLLLLTYLLTHSLTHLLAHSLTHLLTHLTHSLFRCRETV